MHFFGTFVIISIILGLLILFYMAILWFCNVRPIGNRPLFFLGILLFITGIQLFSTGFIAENVFRSFPGSNKEYTIEKILKK
jgi:ABC-type multidrug transport system permease subunit